MECITIPNGIICLSRTNFTCPHCGEGYEDDDTYLDRCNNNKCGYARITCKECGKKFGMTYNMKSDAVGFKLITRQGSKKLR